MKVGVIGGNDGFRNCTSFAQTEGYTVYLCDINEELAAKGKERIAKIFKDLSRKEKWTKVKQIVFWRKLQPV